MGFNFVCMKPKFLETVQSKKHPNPLLLKVSFDACCENANDSEILMGLPALSLHFLLLQMSRGFQKEFAASNKAGDRAPQAPADILFVLQVLQKRSPTCLSGNSSNSSLPD